MPRCPWRCGRRQVRC
uniref:Uncharacterized protein n=1 Tax=Arundo donax TaxID=35708 RepID=A0A0A8Y1T3_ARUDO